jgi:hypothetical protein
LAVPLPPEPTPSTPLSQGRLGLAHDEAPPLPPASNGTAAAEVPGAVGSPKNSPAPSGPSSLDDTTHLQSSEKDDYCTFENGTKEACNGWTG